MIEEFNKCWNILKKYISLRKVFSLKELKITPNQGVGPMKFFMDRKEIRVVLGGKIIEFKKTSMSTVSTDSFEDYGVIVYYDNEGKCEAIEMNSPSNPTYLEKNMIGISFAEIKKIIEIQDEEIEVDETGLLSFKLGIGLYAPNLEEPENDFVESVIVFKNGYYD